MTIEKALRKLKKEAAGLGPEIAALSGLPEYTVRRVLRGEYKDVGVISKVVAAAKTAIENKRAKEQSLAQSILS